MRLGGVTLCFFFLFKQRTAYEMRISDWSSDVCSSDLGRSRQRSRPSTPTPTAGPSCSQPRGDRSAPEPTSPASAPPPVRSRAAATDQAASPPNPSTTRALRLFTIAPPVVEAVHGPAIGGGLGLARVPDFRVTCPE